jgi:23S rRNA (guanosine2251-2'-O)-methyltransferase
MIIYGIHPVIEALGAGRVTRLLVSVGAGDRVGAALRLAKARGISVRNVDPRQLDQLTRGALHQGIAAEVKDVEPIGVEALIGQSRGAALIVVLDSIEDPHNVGAILRTVDAAGADGLVRQSRHAAPLGGATAKASAGAVAHVKIAEVVNIARALEVLKQAGVWTIGLAGDAPKLYFEMDFTLPTAIVVGGEGAGLRRLVRDRCDWLASIPMRGHVDSLNVSVATAIVLFEAVRQRGLK